MLRFAVLLLCLLMAQTSAGEPFATTLIVLEGGFRLSSIERRSGPPGSFTVVLEREMPTPGWAFGVDSLRISVAERRIVAQITATGPSRAVAQVLTPSRLELALDPLEPGRYVLEVQMRRGVTGRHRVVYAGVLQATG